MNRARRLQLALARAGHIARDRASLHEAFGRAYSEFIAIRSRDPLLLAQLAADSRTLFGRAFYWPEAEFGPIMAEIETVFATRRWL